MIRLSELFSKAHINCPEWLSYELLEDEWEDAEYSFEEDVHKWTLINELGIRHTITFDGEHYLHGCYYDGLFRPIYEKDGLECINY